MEVKRPTQKSAFFLLPNWKNVALFAVFVLVSIAGMLQRAPIIESPPAQRPSPLGSFNLTFIALLLAFPYYVPLFFYSIMHPSYIFLHYQWAFIAGNFIYLYFLSCLSVSGFYRFNRRFSIWHWVAIIGLPICLIAFYLERLHFAHTSVDDIANYVGWILILSLYLHLTVCAAFFVYDLISKNKATAARSDHKK